jgi:hypothetical protein
MRQTAGGSVGGFSTAGYRCSISSRLGTSHIYGDHQPTTADKSPLSIIPELFSPDHLSGISTLLMSDELAQDDEDAEDYDLDTIERQPDSVLRRREDDEATLVGGRGGAASMNEDSVVFEIGDEDAHDLSDDEDAHKPRHTSIEHARDEGDDNADERVGFLNGGPRSRHRDD